MAFSADDPKWTAYVLNELPGDERAEAERELAESPDARREVADIRRAVDAITLELKAGTVPGLTAQQRAAICDHTTAEALAVNSVALAPEKPKRSRLWLWSCIASAAVFTAVALWLPAHPRDREVSEVAQSNQKASSRALDAMSAKETSSALSSEPLEL